MPLYYILCRVLQTTLTIFLVFDMMVGQCHSVLKRENSRGHVYRNNKDLPNDEIQIFVPSARCSVQTQNQILLKIIPNKTLQKIIKSVLQISKLNFLSDFRTLCSSNLGNTTKYLIDIIGCIFFLTQVLGVGVS